MVCLLLPFVSCGKPGNPVSDSLPAVRPEPGQLRTNPWGCWYLPAGYTPDRKWPLIVLLHPMGSSEIRFFYSEDWITQAEKRGYILCAPKSRLSYWEDDGSDSDTVITMILFMKKNFAVDNDAVCVFGFSSGAHFANTMVLFNRDPDTGKKLFTAWVSGSGGPGFQWDRRFRKNRVEKKWRIPGFYFWGEQEIPPPGKDLAYFLADRGWDITVRPHPGRHYIPAGMIDTTFDWFERASPP
jgi:predicted esterase